MSFAEMHHKLTVKIDRDIEPKLARMVAEALRADYGEKYSSIKQIARHTDASISTIRKWYNGQNPPNSRNLLLLAQHSQSVMRVLLVLIGRWDEWEIYRREYAMVKSRENDKTPSRYSEKSFGINVKVDFAVGIHLNARQLWFLGLLQGGQSIRPAHIAVAWQVSTRIGEKDVAGLVKAKLIRYTGSKRKGRYELFTFN